MELRAKIARTLCEADGYDWFKQSDRGACGKWLKLADEILAIPEIAIALAAQMPDLPQERVGEIMRGLSTGHPSSTG